MKGEIARSMLKKTFIVLGCLVVALGLWFAYDYFHYSPPHMSDEEIKAAAVSELRPLARKIVEPYIGMKDAGVTTQIGKIEIMRVGRVRGKTYLVYRMEYRMLMTPAAIARMGGQVNDTHYYLLGLRLVKKTLNGIKLTGGMEFVGSYNDAAPVDCGHHPDGIFYAYCKDPQITALKVESGNGQMFSAPARNRIVLLAVPPGKEEVYPHFYGRGGQEITPSTVLRIAFVCSQPKAYQHYNNISAQWWPLLASEVPRLNGRNVDAVWIFPDQLPALRTPEMAGKLEQLVQDGVQLIFVGWKDPQDISRLLADAHLEPIDKNNPAAAVYASTDAQGRIVVGSIGIKEPGASPLVGKTLRLKFKLPDLAAVKVGKGEAVAQSYGKASGMGSASTMPSPVSTTAPVKVRRVVIP